MIHVRYIHCLYAGEDRVLKAQLTKWGNSLAVRVPKHVADAAGLRQGDQLELRVAGPGAVRIRKAKRKLTLAQLLRAITPGNCPGETDWGRPTGKEAW